MSRPALILIAATLLAAHPAAAADWQPVPGYIMSRWVKDINPQAPLPEYPRPQLVRAQWQHLNGLWQTVWLETVRTPWAGVGRRRSSFFACNASPSVVS